MAILRSKDIAKLGLKEIEEKLKDLRMEIIKSRVASKKGGKSNLKEIKRTIARLMTFKNMKERTEKKTEIKEVKKTETKSKPEAKK